MNRKWISLDRTQNRKIFSLIELSMCVCVFVKCTRIVYINIIQIYLYTSKFLLCDSPKLKEKLSFIFFHGIFMVNKERISVWISFRTTRRFFAIFLFKQCKIYTVNIYIHLLSLLLSYLFKPCVWMCVFVYHSKCIGNMSTRSFNYRICVILNLEQK